MTAMHTVKVTDGHPSVAIKFRCFKATLDVHLVENPIEPVINVAVTLRATTSHFTKR